MNFSVPDDVKHAFDDAFAGENKSAVVARLMREAVEAKRREERRRARPADPRAVRHARRAGRP